MKARLTSWVSTQALFVAAACSMAVEGATAADVTGTAYSIVVRNVDQPATRPVRPSRSVAPVTGGMLRLVDVRSRRELARSVWDAQLNGYFFQLPLTGAPVASPTCLALVDGYNRYVPVRDIAGNDPGTSFAHPRWDELLGRSSELAGLKAEQATLQAQRQQAGDELMRLQAEASAAGAVTPGRCPLPPPPPPPARPADAMEAADAQRTSAALCALRWEQAIGNSAQLGRLFAEAGLASDWEGRGSAREIAERMQSVRLNLSQSDIALVQDAALKGRTFLQHADGVRALVGGQDLCRRAMLAHAEQARASWQLATEAVKSQPERERQRCEARIARIVQLKQAETQAGAYAAELDRQVGELMRSSSSTEPEPIGHQICQP